MNTPNTTQLFTRKDYLDGKCTHRQYYAQFVTDSIKSLVRSHFGKSLFKSTDEHLNDLPLHHWDNLSNALYGHGISEKMKLAGDSQTLSGRVCILKEAAKQIIESTKV